METKVKRAKRKRIGGKVYTLYRSYGSRYDARAKRDSLKKKGMSARIIEGSGVQNPYALYVH